MSISEILSVKKGGSGPLGITSTLQLFECPRKFTLVQKYGSKSNVNMMRGSIMHLLLEYFYRGEPLPTIDFDPNSEWTAEWDRMWACFRWYRGKYEPREFGKPKGVESRYPQNEKQQALLNNALYPGFSCAFDLDIKPTAKQIEKLNAAHDVVLFPGFWYLLDHKCTAHFSNEWFLDKKYSYQMRTYEAAYRTLFPKRKFGGILINGINWSSPSYGRRLMLLPPMTDEEFEAWERMILFLRGTLKMHNLRANLGLNIVPANPTTGHCIYPSPCQFLGECGAHGQATK